MADKGQQMNMIVALSKEPDEDRPTTGTNDIDERNECSLVPID